MMDATNSPTKKCSKCGLVKGLEGFHRNCKSKDGHLTCCKACANAATAAYKALNLERVRESQRKADKKRSTSPTRKAMQRDGRKRRRIENPEKARADSRRDRLKINARDPERERRYARERYYRNRAKSIAAQYAYKKRRLAVDPSFRVAESLRSRFYNALLRGTKTGSAVRDLGCTIEELRVHLERQFQPGMTWENWGRRGWHIDHIKPLSAFDLTNRDELLQACHFSNLQPMWGAENIRKGGVRRKSQKVSAG